MMWHCWHGWLTQDILNVLRHAHDTVYRCGIVGMEMVLPRTYQVGQPVTFLITLRLNYSLSIQKQTPQFTYRIYVFPRLNIPATINSITDFEALLSSLNLKFIHTDFCFAFETTFVTPAMSSSSLSPTAVPTVDELPVGMTVHGEWEVVQKLGSGGMGQVYEVKHRLMGWRAALKMCVPDSPDPAERQSQYDQFLAEARALAQLSHPNIVRLYDVWDAAVTGTVFILEEFVSGQPLSNFIPSPEPFVLWVGQEMCKILEVIHSHNIIHRDIKPDNIIVVGGAGAMSLKLIDFGIARRYRPGATQDTAAFGTEGYAPPEQYGAWQTDARSDIYSLAATLYHVLTGDDPRNHPHSFPLLASNNAAIARVLEKALKPDPMLRYQSAREFGDALQRC